MTARLATQQSSYLRSAKDQPVHWYPWSDEAFARARREARPILLDIGAVWCHWCHVMDHESYEDPEIAELLNRDWVCIKVDRDERPDVDARYQRAVQALTGQGGWPLTAFLTPDGDVFYGGTYFPPDGKHGRPGFRAVLTELARLYREDPERVARQAGEIAGRLRAARTEATQGSLSPEVLAEAADHMARQFDFRHGGFGAQPKFPHPGACDFLLNRWFDTRQTWQWEIVERTLSGMARGGIRDHVGGGFHRYAVDARWIVPHFEKMLYDNSELLRAYVHAAGAAAAPAPAAPSPPGDAGQLYTEVIDGIVRWVSEVMSDPAGGYHASQDADVGPDDDGDYFTWTPDEARAVVAPDEFEALTRHYDIDEAGEMHHHAGKNVLWIRQPPEAIAAAMQRTPEDVERLLAAGRAKLKRARDARPTPFVDRTLYTGWNAMMASAMLEAAAFLDRPDLERHALATLERLFREAAAPDLAGGMRHAPGSDVDGILDDQVQAAAAALDAYEATGDDAWQDRAGRLMELVWRDYRADDGGLRDTARGRGGVGFLAHELTPAQDAPTPSPNGVAGIVIARLAAHAGDERWSERCRALLDAFAGGLAELSVFGATLLRAADWALMPLTHVVVVGEDDEATMRLHRAARAAFRPRKVLTRLAPDATSRNRLPPVLQAMLDGAAPRAYVCAGTQCAAPMTAPDALTRTLATFGLGN